MEVKKYFDQINLRTLQSCWRHKVVLRFTTINTEKIKLAKEQTKELKKAFNFFILNISDRIHIYILYIKI